MPKVKLRIHHCLLGRCESGPVRRVYSKSHGPLAMSQLAGKEPTTSDQGRGGLDGRRGQSWPSARSLPPRSPAAHRSRRTRLNILTENIEDQPHNVTRFAVIAEVAEQQRTGRDKTSLMLRLPNQVGSLVKTISPFEDLGVNPASGWNRSQSPTHRARNDPSYLFFVDVERQDATPRSRKRSRPSASGANGSTSWDRIPAARSSRPSETSRTARLALGLHLFDDPP